VLTRTFCHLSGVGLNTERALWEAGCTAWDDLIEGRSATGRARSVESLRREAVRSKDRLGRRDAAFFGRSLPSGQQWRLFEEFRDSVAYVDIETTGLGDADDHITSIALYDGAQVRHYVYGQNLDEFPGDLERYGMIVTYNGKCFDVPWLERHFYTRFELAHVDLRYVLASLGLRGGLKNCERQMGLDRGELDGVDGFFAVLLWREYERTGNPRVLDTLLAYNVQDVLNLEPLMIEAYNRKLRETPFADELALAPANPPPNPFRADPGTLRKLRGGTSFPDGY